MTEDFGKLLKEVRETVARMESELAKSNPEGINQYTKGGGAPKETRDDMRARHTAEVKELHNRQSKEQLDLHNKHREYGPDMESYFKAKNEREDLGDKHWKQRMDLGHQHGQERMAMLHERKEAAGRYQATFRDSKKGTPGGQADAG